MRVLLALCLPSGSKRWRPGALQTISIIAAFPFMVQKIFMATSLLRAFRDEQRQKELHEALLQERIQRLLEEHEAERQDAEPEAGENARGKRRRRGLNEAAAEPLLESRLQAGPSRSAIVD